MRKLPNEYNFLTPYRSNNLKRLGINKDGGYIVDSFLLKQSNFLISLGMANEYSFEEDFLKIDKNNNLIIYDFSISNIHYIKEIFKNIRRILKFKRTLKDFFNCIVEYLNFLKFINKKNVVFFSKKISHNVKSKKEISLKSIFHKFKKKNIILKIDIECAEYEIINDFLAYSENINQIIVEFHDIHLRKEEFFEKIKIMQKNFFITHLHANNFRDFNKDGFPINIEITFINNKFFTENYKQNFNYPIKGIDYPNNEQASELYFEFSRN